MVGTLCRACSEGTERSRSYSLAYEYFSTARNPTPARMLQKLSWDAPPTSILQLPIIACTKRIVSILDCKRRERRYSRNENASIEELAKADTLTWRPSLFYFPKKWCYSKKSLVINDPCFKGPSPPFVRKFWVRLGSYALEPDSN
ncbi:hypothetical protein Hypma_004148 [Hypsizygus marmoreus]|uniref:Uncharacterized protein n=1 Tax=Hypsizygus marmoreus TaxID=39966 RepID=A0A369J323_HYPMA|nr:hypothetical protein Hypma_004148 [Hypsizygus marmoreus]